MRRIWIAGSSGSGKTTLANIIGEKYNIPVYHRDLITWDKNDNMRPEEEQVSILKEITSAESWIFEGARFTSSKIDGRLDKCDTIIYLNINRFTCLYRALRRAHRQAKNPDIPDNERQPYGWAHIKGTLIEYPGKKNQRKEIFKIASEKGINVIMLNNAKQVKKFCGSL